jgi:hypothetical protein
MEGIPGAEAGMPGPLLRGGPAVFGRVLTYVQLSVNRSHRRNSIGSKFPANIWAARSRIRLGIIQA